MSITQIDNKEIEFSKVDGDKTFKKYIDIDSEEGRKLIKESNIIIDENFGEKSDAEKSKELYDSHSINIKNSAQKVADSLTDKYPKIEQDSWVDMSVEADNDGGPLLDSVTDGMSAEQKQEFIDTIKTKCVYFKSVRASLIRQRLIFSDQLESIKDDLKELQNFEVNYIL